MTGRPYQIHALDAIRQGKQDGCTRQLVVLATGGGKTFIIGNLAKEAHRPPGTQLFTFVHLETLVTQTAAFIRALQPHLKVDIEKAKEFASPDADVVVASTQSLAARDLKRLMRFDPNRVSAVAMDEAHHATNNTVMQILKHFRVLKGEDDEDKSKLLVGFTATPTRGDGVGLGRCFDKAVYERYEQDLVREGYLVPTKNYLIHTTSNISGVKAKASPEFAGQREFITGQLDIAINVGERNQLAVDTYQRLTPGRRFVAFCGSIAHSQAVAERFSSAGIPVHHVDGKTKDKRALIDDLKEGRVMGLTSCMAIGEGVDIPMLEVALMLKPSLSEIYYTQTSGRVKRPYPPPEVQVPDDQRKRYAHVIDFVDITSSQRPITSASLAGLPPAFDCKGESIHAIRKKIATMLTACPVDISKCSDLSEIEAMIAKVDIIAPTEVAAAVAKFSRMEWREVPGPSYLLGTLRGTLSVVRNALGNWEYFMSDNGHAYRKGAEHTLKSAILAAERLIPADERTVSNATARWKSDPPSEKQCASLFYMVSEIQRQFITTGAFYRHALENFQRRRPGYDKGGFSAAIDRANNTRRRP